MTDGAYLYILSRSDGSYYVGMTRSALELRIAQHNAGTFGGYTASRRPVTLIFSQWFDRITDDRSRAQAQEVEPSKKRSIHARRPDYLAESGEA
jgi:predicted GIY-YIG superfamily endonuclease